MGRRLGTALQHCANLAHTGLPPGPEGTRTPPVTRSLGTGSILGQGRIGRCQDDQRQIGDGEHEAGIPRSVETSPHSG